MRVYWIFIKVNQQKQTRRSKLMNSVNVVNVKDNPEGVIRFFNSLKSQGQNHVSLFIYHNNSQFAQNLFKGGRNEDKAAYGNYVSGSF